MLEADQVLVGRNATRRAYNARMRERRGFEDPLPIGRRQAGLPAQQPQEGPVQRRAVDREGAPATRKPDIITMRLAPDDGDGTRDVKVSVRPECFTGDDRELDWPLRKRYDEFDYGYVLTVHKAQGSQWDDVVLFDESFAFPGQRATLALHGHHARGEAVDGGGMMELQLA